MPARSTLARTLLLIGRLILAAIFLLAAYGKLRPLTSTPWSLDSLKITPATLSMSALYFSMEVDSYQLLPLWGVKIVADTIPWLELALGLLLLAGIGLRYTATLSGLLLLLLFGVVTRSFLLHQAINCGCFGPNEKLSGWTVVRDGFFVALSVAVVAGATLLQRPVAPSAPAAGTEHAS